MLEANRKLGGGFGGAVVGQDYEAAHALFAPSLAASTSAYDLEDAVQAKIDEISEIIGLGRSAHPGGYELAEVDATLEELRGPRPFDPPREIPAEVTGETYRGWVRVRFVPGEGGGVDIDAWFDVWLLVVDLGDGPRVGFLEIVDSD
jgi:hypothetical protein